jgi:hypothetical protein
VLRVGNDFAGPDHHSIWAAHCSPPLEAHVLVNIMGIPSTFWFDLLLDWISFSCRPGIPGRFVGCLAWGGKGTAGTKARGEVSIQAVQNTRRTRRMSDVAKRQ